MADEGLARITLRSLGGTVAMTSSERGAAPTLGAQDLLAAVPALRSVARIDAVTASSIPGASLELAQILALHPDLERACAEGADGVVVTQGTDTLEETSYLLDLLWTRPEPLVLTGAMRAADAVGADGPANLLAAVTVAAAKNSVGRGTVVVLNDEIHLARRVRKMHTTSPAAFTSPSTGPVGRVHEGGVVYSAPPTPRACLTVSSARPVPRVALLRVALGADSSLLQAAAQTHDGLVIEALGGGHVPSWWVAPILEAVGRIPVVLASRTGAGLVLQSTYDFPGSERGLLASGVLSARDLDGLKARLLLIISIMASSDRSGAEARFEDQFECHQGQVHQHAQ